MKGFVYFVELGNRMALLPDEGGALRCLLGSVECAGVRGDQSPKGVAGVMCWRPGVDRSAVEKGMRGGESGMDWREWGTLETRHGAARCWVGLDVEGVPGPEDLRRDRLFDGREVTLGDGRVWVLPRLMYCTGDCGLPQAAVLEGDELRMRPMRRYEALARDGRRVWEYVLGMVRYQVGKSDRPEVLTGREALEVVSRALGLNYHVGVKEVGALELVTMGQGGNVFEVLAALVDVELYMGAEKKTAVGDGMSS